MFNRVLEWVLGRPRGWKPGPHNSYSRITRSFVRDYGVYYLRLGTYYDVFPRENTIPAGWSWSLRLTDDSGCDVDGSYLVDTGCTDFSPAVKTAEEAAQKFQIALEATAPGWGTSGVFQRELQLQGLILRCGLAPPTDRHRVIGWEWSWEIFDTKTQRTILRGSKVSAHRWDVLEAMGHVKAQSTQFLEQPTPYR